MVGDECFIGILTILLGRGSVEGRPTLSRHSRTPLSTVLGDAGDDTF